MALKVAIVGLSEASRHLAPWNDPEWEVWGLPWDAEHKYRFHRTFEMHQLSMLEAGYLRELPDCQRLYMQEQYAEVPNAIAYPLDEVGAATGHYWCSSLAYALALAITEQAEEIAIYGVDCSEEYAYQAPNMEYLIGLARGKGIKVHIPEQSPLVKFVSDPDFEYAGRYGWLGD